MPVLSEENGTPPSYDTRRQWPSLFVVDPLDGTKDFVKRTGEFTVNIALVTRGEDGRYAPVLGVVHVPATSTSFWAERGHGAFMKDSQGVRPVRASDPPIDQEGLRVVSSASHPDGLTKVLMDEAFRNPVSEQARRPWGSPCHPVRVTCLELNLQHDVLLALRSSVPASS